MIGCCMCGNQPHNQGMTASGAPSQRMLSEPFRNMVDKTVYLLGQRRSWCKGSVERTLRDRLSLQELDQCAILDVISHHPVRQQRDSKGIYRRRPQDEIGIRRKGPRHLDLACKPPLSEMPNRIGRLD